MATVTTTTKLTAVTLTMSKAEAENLLTNLRRYHDGQGRTWDGPIMYKLATALGRKRSVV